MRQRKVKNLEERILEYKRYAVDGAEGFRGTWSGVFGNENDIYLEIGAGKGGFLIRQAEAHPGRNYVGAEGRASVAFRALEKLARSDADNVRFICGFVNDPGELFSENELSGIYLNFSDPWPKKRHEARRLTHRNYLESYGRILKKGGTVEIKTDDSVFFEFALTELAKLNEFEISAMTRDLRNSDLAAKDFTTEYEEKFAAMGKMVSYAIVVAL